MREYVIIGAAGANLLCAMCVKKRLKLLKDHLGIFSKPSGEGGMALGPFPKYTSVEVHVRSSLLPTVTHIKSFRFVDDKLKFSNTELSQHGHALLAFVSPCHCNIQFS